MDLHEGSAQKTGNSRLLPLTLTAIGVVYGDIGTSPLYTIRECFFGAHAVALNHDNVLGVLSLILYALLIVVSVKYIAIVMRADNQGEGGILALATLMPEKRGRRQVAGRLAEGRPVLVLLAIFGAALLYGDGMITPAITVLGAIEGLTVATPLFSPYVMPLSLAIIVGIFLIQRFGTDKVGRLFGPVMVVWFVTIAVLGVTGIVREPAVIAALNPAYGFRFFVDNGWHGFAVLGAVVLAVTGGEALYADMGHFGKRPIRLAWYGLVLPSLMLNYFGQGALVLSDQHNATQPFFLLAPILVPVPAGGHRHVRRGHRLAGAHLRRVLADAAGDPARLRAAPRHRPHLAPRDGPGLRAAGELGLMFCTIAIVLGFQTSTALAATYGIAVTITMVITAMLLHVVMTERWKWPPLVAAGHHHHVPRDRRRADGRQPAEGRRAAAGCRSASRRWCSR